MLSYLSGVTNLVKFELNIRINRQIKFFLSIDWIHKIVEKALSVSGLKSPLELSLIITGDESIRRLNKKYRGLNETTDVLSFALTEKDISETIPFIMPPDGVTHLGEIVISYPRAKIQAEQESCTIEKELALLITHGVLHLAGFDHDEPQKECEMKLLESKVLQGLK